MFDNDKFGILIKYASSSIKIYINICPPFCLFTYLIFIKNLSNDIFSSAIFFRIISPFITVETSHRGTKRASVNGGVRLQTDPDVAKYH